MPTKSSVIYFGQGHEQGLPVEIDQVPSLTFKSNIPSNLQLHLAEFKEAHPVSIFACWGSLRDYLVASIQGTYFYASWNRQPKLKDLDKLMAPKEGVLLEQDEDDRFYGIGFTQEIYNFHEFADVALYKPHMVPVKGSRMIILDTSKEIITSNQYEVAGNFLDAFDLFYTDDPRKIRVKPKSDLDNIQKFYWDKGRY